MLQPYDRRNNVSHNFVKMQIIGNAVIYIYKTENPGLIKYENKSLHLHNLILK